MNSRLLKETILTQSCRYRRCRPQVATDRALGKQRPYLHPPPRCQRVNWRHGRADKCRFVLKLSAPLFDARFSRGILFFSFSRQPAPTGAANDRQSLSHALSTDIPLLSSGLPQRMEDALHQFDHEQQIHLAAGLRNMIDHVRESLREVAAENREVGSRRAQPLQGVNFCLLVTRILPPTTTGHAGRCGEDICQPESPGQYPVTAEELREEQTCIMTLDI